MCQKFIGSCGPSDPNFLVFKFFDSSLPTLLGLIFVTNHVTYSRNDHIPLLRSGHKRAVTCLLVMFSICLIPIYVHTLEEVSCYTVAVL
jgi:hypothetical protein